MTNADHSRLVVVVPVFNEERNVAAFVAATRDILETLDLDWTILFVDDGSRDGTVPRIREENAKDGRVRAVLLSRNFGKEVAIAAGLQRAEGSAVVIMDGDLQHPPATIAQFVSAWRGGHDVVFGHRVDGGNVSVSRKFFSKAFYWLFRKLSQTRIDAGAVDFVLLDAVAVAALNRFGERTRFTKGLLHWIGFRSTTVPFLCGERAAGRSTFNFTRLLAFGRDGIVAFSSLPLRVWSGVGAVISLGALAYAGYFILKTWIRGVDVPGFPSLLVSIMFFAGVQLISLGVVGEYLSRVYEEVKARPLFIVAAEIGEGGVVGPLATPPVS